VKTSRTYADKIMFENKMLGEHLDLKDRKLQGTGEVLYVLQKRLISLG
jgi:hypothetical protein